METIYISLAAAGGALGSSFLGWLTSKEDFIPRKFMASFMRAVLAGGAFAVTYSTVMGAPTIGDMVVAFGAGAGIDVLGHRVAGSVKAG